MNNLIVLNKNDNVGVTQFIIPEKTKIEGKDIVTKDPIPFGHKVCLKNINKGDPVIKYDQIIGFDPKNINIGEHVHFNCLQLIVLAAVILFPELTQNFHEFVPRKW